MATNLYSQTIKNIVSGISQQPAILRLPEQLEEQINGYSTEVGGLQKGHRQCISRICLFLPLLLIVLLYM